MTLTRSLLILLILSTTVLSTTAGAGAQRTDDCKDWQACRALALDAAKRGDNDAFHDLAWRTVQLGPKNDPALMLLLARAQSLSGRPHDALVMLQRLAVMGAATDAATSDDFARVRALPGWAELEAKLAGKPLSTPAPPVDAPTPPPPPSTPPPASKAKPEPSPKPEPTPKEKPAAAAAKPSIPDPRSPTAEATTSKPPEPKPTAPRSLAFPTSGVQAVGLAYDAVSGRFLIGDRQERRLFVIGERSGRLANLTGVDSGFNDLSAFEIDTQEGDLWVVSGSSQGGSTVHKLQLISGRILTSIALPAELGPARLTDVAVTAQHILVLDSEGRRIFRIAKKGRAVDLLARVAVPSVSSLAPASETTAYAAYDQGLLYVDLAGRAISVVEPHPETDLGALGWIRWHRGALLGLQKIAPDDYRLIRIRLDAAGRAVRGVDVLADHIALAGSMSATISGGTVYYLALTAAKDEVEVKKLAIK